MSVHVDFQWRGLTVSGEIYEGDIDDGMASSFDCEGISLGGVDLPDFLYEFCLTGKHFDSMQEAAWEKYEASHV